MLAPIVVLLLTPTDDHEVIQTAMLSLLKHEVWHSSDWHPKDYVVLYPEYSKSPPSEFVAVFGEMQKDTQRVLAWYRKSENAKTAKHDATAAYQERTLSAFGRASKVLKEPGKYVASKPRPLTELPWDKRIRLTKKSNWYGSIRMKGDEKTGWDPKLEEHTIYAYPSPPVYSPNGKLAIVNFGIPWSMHGSDVYILLQRTPSGWEKLLATSKFYV